MTIRVCLLAGAALLMAAPSLAGAQTPGLKAPTVSGRIFYDISDRGDGAEFDLKRFYVAVDQRFSDVLSANLTTDFQYSTRDGSSDFFVKKAYLQAKPVEAITLRAGAADTPWITYVDSVYAYRWIEKNLIDRTGFGQSSDWGVHALGEVGAISYAVSALDGGGHRNPSKSHSVDIEGRVGARISAFQVGIGGYTGDRGKDVDGRPALHTARRANAMLAYAPKAGHRLGIDVFAAENWDNVISTASDRSRGYSIFGAYVFNRQFSAFSRYDRVEPTRRTAPAREDAYFNLGAAYTPVRNVDLALVYKRQTRDTATARQVSDEVGVFGQLRF